MKRLLSATLLFTAAAAPALAHVSAEHASMLSGLAHPLTGADHMLAMLATGLWAAQLGGKARLALPAAFAISMLAGFALALALAGAGLPFVEPAILASVVGLGLLSALAIRIPAEAGAALVAVFALFHGFAHGAEFAGAAASTFALGFVAASLAITGAGLGLGMLIKTRAPRLAGSLALIAGTALMLG